MTVTERRYVDQGFQTFFVSFESSNCPSVTEILQMCKKITECKIGTDTNHVVSVGYGKRIVITAPTSDTHAVAREDIVEIVDYDPVKKVVLVIGKKEPPSETPVHWFIHRARTDVNAIIQLNDTTLVKHLSGRIPATESEQPVNSLELTKEVLKTLRRSNRILIKKRGVLVIGVSLNEVEQQIMKTCEEIRNEG